ncbi:MAG: NAD-glutamate dehydrogenase, partial [Oleibacter sp.]|nr:NAD-glutamate dehydrogenase [Thalassolituus sp.]
QTRRADNKGLTRPELSVLISYTKADLKERLNTDTITQDPHISAMVATAFPDALAAKFAEPMKNHRLHREIIATQLANDMVNFMGITFISRMKESSGATASDIARAYVTARDIFGLKAHWQEINALDYKISTKLQETMMLELMRLVRRATRWILRNRRNLGSIADEVAFFAPALAAITNKLGDTLRGDALETWQVAYQQRVDAGVPQSLAAFTAGASELYASLGIIEAASRSQRDPALVTQAYFGIGEHLSLNWFLAQINALPASNYWEAMARESFRDDLDWQLSRLTVGILDICQDGEDLLEAITRWEESQTLLVNRWRNILQELKSTDSVSFPMIAVALRELLDLAMASQDKALPV